jgi:hypothetical protein
MSENIRYELDASFSNEEKVNEFSKEKCWNEHGFNEIEIIKPKHSPHWTITIINHDGWRGGGSSAEELIREWFGETIKKYRKYIEELDILIEYLDQIPTESICLEDFDEVEE